MLNYFSDIKQENRLNRNGEASFGTLFIRSRWHYQLGLIDKNISRNKDAKIKDKQINN